MRFFKRVLGILGFSKDDEHDHDHDQSSDQPHPIPFQPRRGFGIPAQVVIDRPQIGPILVPSTSGHGGLQGLRWYAKQLRIDEDGDVADKFLDEVSSETLADHHHKATSRFKLKLDARPVKVRGQILSSDGKIQHYVEDQGKKLQLV